MRAERAVGDAIVGDFFVRSAGQPLGEVRTHGIKRRSTPFAAPWGAQRACVHAQARLVTIDRRLELPARPRGDLLQAGPLLVSRGQALAFVPRA
jgi:hypothetical protein